MRPRTRGLLGGAAILLSTCAVTACGAVQGIRAVPDLARANTEASSVCSRAHADATFATAVFAGYAAEQLRSAGLDPEPWSRMAPSTIIFQCFRSPPVGDGQFVDSDGQATVAPPLGTGEHCTRTATSDSCSIATFTSP